MRIKFHAPIDPGTGRRPEVIWPEAWGPPRVGDEVECSGMGTRHWVEDVIWYPEARPRSYVYVTLTTRRPGR